MKLPKNLNPLYSPFGQYQTDSIGFGVIKRNPGLLLDLGLGKTYVALNICKWRIENTGVNKILVVCPTSIMLKWLEETHKFTPYRGMILHDEIRNKRQHLLYIFKHNDANFGIINYEGLAPFLDDLLQINFDIIIADESARYIKNPNANRTKAIIELGDLVDYRMILTGRLIANKPMDAWSQFRFLDKGKTFGINFYAWRNYFFRQMKFNRFKKWIPRKDRIVGIRAGIYKNCIVFKKEDVFEDLPEIIPVVINLKMSNNLRTQYKQVKEQIISEIDAEYGTATLNIQHIFTKLVRLQQITSGYVKDEHDRIRNLRETPKLDAIVDEIDSVIHSGESVIVWCRFLHTIGLISEYLKKNKIKHVIMTGADKSTEKTKKWKGFQKSKTINVFIGQVEAGGIGIELFKINSKDEFQHMIFAENTFALDHREQAIGRSYGRIGQHSKCRVVDFIIQNTIDVKILRTIMSNKEMAEEIMKGGITKFLE